MAEIKAEVKIEGRDRVGQTRPLIEGVSCGAKKPITNPTSIKDCAITKSDEEKNLARCGFPKDRIKIKNL